MAIPVLRTRSYDNDLEQVWLYKREESLSAADQTLQGIESEVDRLGDFPDLGERCPDFGALCRRPIVNKYLVYYERYDDRLEILRVVHSARDVRSLDA